jgi:predicted enzyme related to lactoylglutathione lyase
MYAIQKDSGSACSNEEHDVIEAPSYAPGTPMWVDLSTPDLEAARAFYGALFGWEAEEPHPEAGGYTMFTLDGKLVAGLGPIMSPDQPPAWSTYVASADADATIEKVREAGGHVVVEPMDVMEAGRMASFVDPTGAYLGIWQPGQHQGAELVNQPGSFIWNELDTRDIEAAKPFYQRVFGWTARTSGDGGMDYTEWQLDGRSIGGGMQMNEEFPPDVPPHWRTYFAVQDCDAAVAVVQEQGGKVLMPAMDMPGMRFAVVSDPQGATFGVISTR